MINYAPAARQWWQGLTDKDKGDRGAVARLRRASSVIEAATERATFDLCRRLGLGAEQLDRVALVAGVLAHVRNDRADSPMARQLGEPADNPPMKWLRFRRLLQAGTPDEQLTAFRRAIALTSNKTANVGDLADSLLHWNDQRRQRWIFDYYNAGEAAVTSEETTA